MSAASDVSVAEATSAKAPPKARRHDVSFAIVSLRFKTLTKNGEVQSYLRGVIMKKCDLLRSFLLLVFGDKVQEQGGFHFRLVSTSTPKGLPVLDRANALEGTKVSMTEASILDGAFVVNLTEQLKNNAEWMSWPDTPEDPHITLASIGGEMQWLAQNQQTLVLGALSSLAELAVDGVDSFSKLARVANLVRPHVEKPCLFSSRVLETISEISKILETRTTSTSVPRP